MFFGKNGIFHRQIRTDRQVAVPGPGLPTAWDAGLGRRRDTGAVV